jgi:sugar phosphate isomerase/epimerase
MDAPNVGLGCATLMSAGLTVLIEAAARHGFPTLTARPAAFAAALEQGVSEQALRRRLRDAGVAVRMIDALNCLPGESTLDPADPNQRHLPREAFFPPDEETCFRAAEVLEAPFVNVTHFAQKPVPTEQMVDSLGGVCRRAGRRGLGIALEFIPGTGLPDVVATDRIARACGEPNCAITLDPWHWARSGGTLDDVRGLAPGAFFGMQLCDHVPTPAGAAYTPMSGRIVPGEGTLPLVELVSAALANSPGITIEAEIISDELRAMAIDDAAAHVAAKVDAWRKTFHEHASA